MAKSKPTSGLTLDQIDAITLEICKAEALTEVVHGRKNDGTDICLLTLLEERLAKIKGMVLERQIGGRHA